MSEFPVALANPRASGASGEDEATSLAVCLLWGPTCSPGPLASALPYRRDIVWYALLCSGLRPSWLRSISSELSAALARRKGMRVAVVAIVAVEVAGTSSAPTDAIVGWTSGARSRARSESALGRVGGDGPVVWLVIPDMLLPRFRPSDAIEARRCCSVLGRRMGQRCTRRRKPCCRHCLTWRACHQDRRERTLMTPKLVNLRTSMPSLCTSYSSIHSRTVFPARKREYRCSSVGQSGITLPVTALSTTLHSARYGAATPTWFRDVWPTLVLDVTFVCQPLHTFP